MQLDRSGERVAPKTESARRSIQLPPTLIQHLREHREAAFAAGEARPEDFVFRSETGGPLQHRNVVRRGLEKAIEAADLGVAGQPKITWHSLRHTHASVLIAKRLAVTYVARRLGHPNPAITLGVYGHLSNEAEDDKRATDELEAVAAGKALEDDGGERVRIIGQIESGDCALRGESVAAGE